MYVSGAIIGTEYHDFQLFVDALMGRFMMCIYYQLSRQGLSYDESLTNVVKLPN